MKTNSLCVCALTLTAASATASVTYPFTSISNNNAASAAAGEAQLRVTVVDWAPGQVGFTFTNVGADPMSITNVYFDDGSLLGISTIINGPGVNFSLGGSPGNLPGGDSLNPPFVTTAGFSAGGAPPPVASGVQPGEFLTIVFDLINGKTYSDVIFEMDLGVELRVGIHVRGFNDGWSESFATPAPGAVALLGLGGLFAARRRR